MRKHIAAMVGAFSVLITASLGLAATSEPNSLLTEGYDSESHILIWGTADHPNLEAFEGTLDCRLESGTYTYEVGEDGEVASLTDDEGTVVSHPSAEEDGEPSDYDPSGECGLTATSVVGPEGQVNHGTVVSNFISALKGAGVKGIGCYVRIIAQSDYGKGTQQVTVEEAAEAEESEPASGGEASLTTHETLCGKPTHAGQGRPIVEGDEGDEEGSGRGRPQWAGQGRPDHAGPSTDSDDEEAATGSKGKSGNQGGGRGRP